MAWRLWYQPQVAHTTCGSLAAEQRGQMLRAGAASFQLAARRLRPFILLVRFLGTAIAGAPTCGGPGNDSGSLVEPQIVECGPARVAVVYDAVARRVVSVRAARRAQTGAVLAAQGRQRQLEQHGVADELG